MHIIILRIIYRNTKSFTFSLRETDAYFVKEMELDIIICIYNILNYI